VGRNQPNADGEPAELGQTTDSGRAGSGLQLRPQASSPGGARPSLIRCRMMRRDLGCMQSHSARTSMTAYDCSSAMPNCGSSPCELHSSCAPHSGQTNGPIGRFAEAARSPHRPSRSAEPMRSFEHSSQLPVSLTTACSQGCHEQTLSCCSTGMRGVSSTTRQECGCEPAGSPSIGCLSLTFPLVTDFAPDVFCMGHSFVGQDPRAAN